MCPTCRLWQTWYFRHWTAVKSLLYRAELETRKFEPTKLMQAQCDKNKHICRFKKWARVRVALVGVLAGISVVVSVNQWTTLYTTVFARRVNNKAVTGGRCRHPVGLYHYVKTNCKWLYYAPFRSPYFLALSFYVYRSLDASQFAWLLFGNFKTR